MDDADRGDTDSPIGAGEGARSTKVDFRSGVTPIHPETGFSGWMAYIGCAVSSSQIGVTYLNPSRCERDGFKLYGAGAVNSAGLFLVKGAKAL